MIRFIQNLLGSLFSFLIGLFRGRKAQDNQASLAPNRKKSGYFMEYEDGQSASNGQAASAQPAAKPEEPAAKPVAVVSQPSASDPSPAPAKLEAAKPSLEPAKPAKTEGSIAINNNGQQPQPTATFAPTYLMSTRTAGDRRRPGPNMNYFMDMARTVKPST